LGAGKPRSAVWLKQNCGVRLGADEGWDIVGGDGCDGRGEGGEETVDQKYDARSKVLFVTRGNDFVCARYLEC
jgi:hypothetical protein